MTPIKYTRPFIYPKQEDAIFHDERIGIVEASTKSGKTHGCIIWLLEKALFAPKAGRHYWWVAPVYAQTKIAYNRMKRAVPAKMVKTNDSELQIILFNGSVIQFKSAEKPDNLYGEDVYAAVIDEATRAREESWWAIRSTLTATRGDVRIIGNVRGRRNWVYKLARSRATVRYAKITAWDAVDAGIVDREEILAAQQDLPEHIFKELYEAEASDDGGNPFSLKHLAAASLAEPPAVVGTVRAWGIDLAKAQDWTVVTGIDEFGYVAEHHRWQDTWENTTERIIRLIGTRTPALCDSTGVGDPIVERLQTAGCNVEGYIFSGVSKQILFEGLRLGIQRSELTWCNAVLQDEIEAFEYHYTRTGVRYEAPEGGYDDCVDSLGLAYKVWYETRTMFWAYDNSSDETEDLDLTMSNRMRRLAERTKVREGRGEMAGIMGRDF